MQKKCFILFLFSFLCAYAVFAADLQVLGLFKDKVMIQIDGQTQVLKVGEEKSGVTLIKADSEECIVQMNGKQTTLKLGTQVSSRFMPQNKIFHVMLDDHGLYKTIGKINGKEVSMVVDTGANVVALNVDIAERLGLTYENTKPVFVETASGKAKGYPIIINQISMGNLTAYDVRAVIVEGTSPEHVLLGFTFLKNFNVRNKEDSLELTSKL